LLNKNTAFKGGMPILLRFAVLAQEDSQPEGINVY